MTYRQRVLTAAGDPEWQKFRRSLKGISTEDKLKKLRRYWENAGPGRDENHVWGSDHNGGDCEICIQVDNYIKALCRGGQLYPQQNLELAVRRRFRLDIKKN